MKKTDPQHLPAKTWKDRLEQVWYGLIAIDCEGNLQRSDRRHLVLGFDLIGGLLVCAHEAPVGDYAVVAWKPVGGQRLPDWGLFRVRGPGSWVLRSLDGETCYAPCGDGTCVRMGPRDS